MFSSADFGCECGAYENTEVEAAKCMQQIKEQILKEKKMIKILKFL